MFAELHAALRQADEDYLIGLSNKGTVKRAKKDLEGLTPAAQEEDQAVQVRLGEEVCTIRAPLGDSTCTCPAPGMCRHRTRTPPQRKNPRTCPPCWRCRWTSSAGQ